MRNIGLFFGGKSVEHDVSIVSAQIISKGFAKLTDQFKLIPIYITPTGNWVVFKDFPAIAKLKQIQTAPSNVSIVANPKTNQLILKQGFLKGSIKIDVAFPLIHGTNGEDGTLQGLFQSLNVPYVGPAVLGSAVGMDKIIFKDILKANDLPTVKHTWFTRADWKQNQDKIISKITEQISYPIFIKPANLGSSIGITKATNKESLVEAIEVAVRYAPRIIAEQGIVDLKEINCAVLGYKNPEPSLLEEPLHYSEFLTFSDKYIGGGKGGSMKGLKSKVKIPAPVSDDIKKKIQTLAISVFQLLDCAGVARVDFILSPDNQIYINEINTIPGSLQQHLWQASGIKLPELLTKAIISADEVFADQDQNLTSFESALLK